MNSEISHEVMKRFGVLIEKKVCGEELTDNEIREITNAIITKKIPDFQLSAFLMAVYFQSMSIPEASTWTEELMLSGDIIDLGMISAPKVDRCSTGGVGDKSAFVLMAIAACCGIAVPTLVDSYDGLVIPDLDKMSSIPGFDYQFDAKKFQKQLKKIGCCYYKQPENIAPVDVTLDKVRRLIGTISSVPLVTGSILGSKLSSGADGVVVDVKWGNGSFVKDMEQAKQLGRMITRVARALNKKCIAIVTDANQPLGKTVGTWLEIKETIELLQGQGDVEMQDLILRVGMEFIRLAGVAGSTLSAKQLIIKKLSDGSALNKFKELIAEQGGDISYIDNPEKYPQAKYSRKLAAQKRGYIHTVNAGMIARGVSILSKKPDGTIDHMVGVSDIMKVGMQIKQGEPLIMIHYNDETNLESALEYFRDAYRLAPKRPALNELIVERIA
ncbi:MAG: thymidine phosphorylase [Puniceicoccales bacterium]|jgi:pyrimidine-nucleoside phosphorylase|nr:thymidine phosphorylase [Puniceicoccales bacterium]MDR1232940.1 thymidine phosphorylase [Puniceicoccales bacterium]